MLDLGVSGFNIVFMYSCCGVAFIAVVIFFWIPSYPGIFISLRQTLFFETARNHLEPNEGKRGCVPFQ
jgi:hypothetical protein